MHSGFGGRRHLASLPVVSSSASEQISIAGWSLEIKFASEGDF